MFIRYAYSGTRRVMIPTPEVGHLRRPEFRDDVYDPAEDTFALMDALEDDANALKTLGVQLCVEIGYASLSNPSTGSGCVSTFVSQILGSSAAYVCTDINYKAALCTIETGERNHVR